MDGGAATTMRALDAAIAPVLWIGAGASERKDPRHAGYLAARQRASIWYEVDVEDRDPGTLGANLATCCRAGHAVAKRRGAVAAGFQLGPARAAELLFTQLLSGARLPEAALPGARHYQEAGREWP